MAIVSSTKSPTVSRILQLLTYSRETGQFTWLPRDVSEFTGGGHSAAHICARWNTNYAGKEAGAVARLGYRSIRIDGHLYYAHRLAWMLEHDEWPPFIDHINGDPGDNSIINLRSVTIKENLRNQGLRKGNLTGIVGVSWHTLRAKWQARIMVNGRSIHLGLFDDIEDAKRARLAAEKEYGFHPNHGKREGRHLPTAC